MTHPLTQKKVWKLVEKVTQTTDWNNCDDYEDVLYARAAADWQLEQVIKWLKDYTKSVEFRYHPQYVVTRLKEEMRPQQQENNQ